MVNIQNKMRYLCMQGKERAINKTNNKHIFIVQLPSMSFLMLNDWYVKL